MAIRRLAASFVVGILWAVVVPATASAQSAIAGTITDNTGAVMPGVTVEAASPVLIEKVRSVVSDGQGRYTIIDLRPGTYTISYSLPGFTTAVREGLFLPADFVATVNIQLSVGALEESVTVTGQNPARGRAVVGAHRGDHRELARCAPDPAKHAVVRLPRAGRAAQQAGCGRRADDGAGQHARARSEPAAHDDADRRHAHQPGVQRRRSSRTTSTRRHSRRPRSRRAPRALRCREAASAST